MVTNETVFEYLVSQMEEQRNVVITSIVKGTLAPNEYNRLCGVLQGLEYAKDVVNNLAKTLEESDE